jgi:hypothetical protein
MQSGALVPADWTGTESPCDVMTSFARRRFARRIAARPCRISDQLVGRLERVEDGGQPEVEDAVESEYVDAHGKYDIKNGVLANTPDCAVA